MEWAEIYTQLAHDRENPAAWEALRQRVRAWTRGQLRDQTWHGLEDVVADTCSSVAVMFDRARGEATFAGFVYGCYLNERRRVLDFRRGRWACVSLDADTVSDIDARDDAAADWSTLWEALLALPPRYRAAVTLRHLEGMSAEDIADYLAVTPGNARQLVHKGLLGLRRRLVAARTLSHPVESSR
jgi:RNA polymerase sigma factor (sigma-70 family)